MTVLARAREASRSRGVGGSIQVERGGPRMISMRACTSTPTPQEPLRFASGRPRSDRRDRGARVRSADQRLRLILLDVDLEHADDPEHRARRGVDRTERPVRAPPSRDGRLPHVGAAGSRQDVCVHGHGQRPPSRRSWSRKRRSKSRFRTARATRPTSANKVGPPAQHADVVQRQHLPRRRQGRFERA